MRAQCSVPLRFGTPLALDGPRRPQKAPEGYRRPQKAPGRPQQATDGPRRPQKAPESPRRPQKAPEGPRRPQKAPEGTRRPQKAPESTRRPQKPPEGQRKYQAPSPKPKAAGLRPQARPQAPNACSVALPCRKPIADRRSQLGADRRLQITDGSRSLIADRGWGVGGSGVAVKSAHP